MDTEHVPPAAVTLADLIREVGPILKDKENKHDGYSYQSEAAVKAEVQAALIKLGIAPDSVSYLTERSEWIEARGGGKRNLVTVKCVIRILGCGPFEGLGAGVDYGDKATMKGATVAYREAWKSMCCIPSHGSIDSEEHDEANAPAEAAPAQRAPTRRQEPSGDEWSEPPGGERGEAPAPRSARRDTFATLPRMGWLGKYGGVPVSDAPLALLQRYIEWRREKPAESKWQDKERVLLSAISAEIAAREAGEVPTESGSDEVPF